MMELDLEDNCIGPEGAVYIAEALQENTYITHLVSGGFVMAHVMCKDRPIGPTRTLTRRYCSFINHALNNYQDKITNS